ALHDLHARRGAPPAIDQIACDLIGVKFASDAPIGLAFTNGRRQKPNPSYDLADNVLTDTRCCLRQFLDELADQTSSLLPESQAGTRDHGEVTWNASSRGSGRNR